MKTFFYLQIKYVIYNLNNILYDLLWWTIIFINRYSLNQNCLTWCNYKYNKKLFLLWTKNCQSCCDNNFNCRIRTLNNYLMTNFYVRLVKFYLYSFFQFLKSQRSESLPCFVARTVETCAPVWCLCRSNKPWTWVCLSMRPSIKLLSVASRPLSRQALNNTWRNVPTENIPTYFYHLPGVTLSDEYFHMYKKIKHSSLIYFSSFFVVRHVN